MDRQDKTTGAFAGAESNISTLAGPQVATALALMFLVRGTQTSILVEEQLVAGHGLDQITGDIEITPAGRVKNPSLKTELNKVLKQIPDEPSEEELKRMLQTRLDDVLRDDPKTQREKSAQLRSLVTHTRFEVRLMSVRAIGRDRNLDNVPSLIFALSDPNTNVVRAARDGLRFISRKFDGFQLPDNAEPQSVQVKRAQENWKAWYLTIRPEAEF